MENRKEDRRTSDRTLKNIEVLYERLDNRIHNAEQLANESRAEFRAVRDEIKKKMDRLEAEMDKKFEALDESLASYRIQSLTTERSERIVFRIERWKFIGVVLGILVSGAVVPMALNWERVEVMASSIAAHFRKAANTPVPLMLDVTKKPHRRRKKKALPPIVLPPEQKEQEHEEAAPAEPKAE